MVHDRTLAALAEAAPCLLLVDPERKYKMGEYEVSEGKLLDCIIDPSGLPDASASAAVDQMEDRMGIVAHQKMVAQGVG